VGGSIFYGPPKNKKRVLFLGGVLGYCLYIFFFVDVVVLKCLQISHTPKAIDPRRAVEK